MRKKIIWIGVLFLVLLSILSIVTYSQEDPQKTIIKWIDDIDSDKAFTTTQIDITTEYKAEDITPAAKIAMREKWTAFSEARKTEYLEGWDKTYFTLSSSELSTLKPENIKKLSKGFTFESVEQRVLTPEQNEAYGVRMGGGASAGAVTGWGGGILLLAAIAFFLFLRFNKTYRYGAVAKKIVDSIESTMALEHREELNRKTIKEIEDRKRKLIKDNLDMAKGLSLVEKKIRDLDTKLKNKTRFKKGIHDKGILEDVNIKDNLRKFGFDDGEISYVMVIAKTGLIPGADELKRIVGRIRGENIKLGRLIEKELVLDKEIMEELLKGKQAADVSKLDLLKIKEFIRHNEEAIKLTGEEKRAIGLIKSEEDTEGIIREGGEVAKSVLLAIHNFKEIVERLSHYSYIMKIQDSILKREDDALVEGNMPDVLEKAEGLEASFNEEVKFYDYIKKKEEEEKIEVLKAFGEMKEVTDLGIIAGNLQKSSIIFGQIITDIDKEFRMLEEKKHLIKAKGLGDDLIEDINKQEERLELNRRKLYAEREVMVNAEKMMHMKIAEMEALKKEKDKKRIEDAKKTISKGIGSLRSGVDDIFASANKFLKWIRLIKKTDIDVFDEIDRRLHKK